MSKMSSFQPSILRRFLVLLFAFWPNVAHADALEDGLFEISSLEFERIARGATLLGSTSSPRALPLLEALEEGRLRVDEGKTVFVFGTQGILRADSGTPGTPRGALRTVEVNNRVRRALGSAIAGLRLRATDAEVRRVAAAEMAKRPSEDLLPLLRAALSREEDGEIVELLELGIARLDLASGVDARRLSALETIRNYAELSLKPEVVRLIEDPKATTPQVRKAALAARSAIESKVFIVNFVANTFYGLSLGSVLLLAALGLAITFGLMRVINMAHGEMLMLGAYVTFAVQKAIEAFVPSLLPHYLFFAVPAAFLGSALAGMALERFVVRHLYGRPLETLLATWGISLMLIQTVRLIFGAQNVTVGNPPWLSGGFELMPNLVLPYSRIAIVGFTLIVVTGVGLLLRRTTFGLQIRAVTQNRAMAASLGVPAARVDLLTFGLGSGLAGLGGVALSQLGNVGPELGQNYIVDSFMVVVLGGVGKLVGTVIGAMGLGLLNKYMEPAFGAVLGKIAILGLIVIFLQRRPQGLFALKGRAAEVQ